MLKRMVIAAVMMGTMLVGMVAVTGPVQAAPTHASIPNAHVSRGVPSSCLGGEWGYITSDTVIGTENEGTYSYTVKLYNELDGLFGSSCHELESVTTTTFYNCVLYGARYCFFSGSEDAYLVFSNGTKSAPSSISGAGTFYPGGSNTLGSVTNGPFLTTCGAAGGDYSSSPNSFHAGSAQYCF